MKKWIIGMIVLALCSVSWADPNDSIALWVSTNNLGYQNTDISVMLGFRRDNLETGAAMSWRMFSEGDITPDDQSTLAIGPYGAYHFPDIVDINNPLDVSWLPEKLAGEPYVAIAYLFDLEGKGTVVTPSVGIRLLDMFNLSYKYNFFNGSAAEDEGRIGLSALWKFD